MAAVPDAAPAVVTATAAPAAIAAASWGAGALHQRLSSFVKKTLLQQLVPSGAVVCDLFCGRGVDTGNWAKAHIGQYVGVDLSASALEEAKEQWEKHGKPFPATFCELDPCMADLEKHLKEDTLCTDVVCCLAHLQDSFSSEDMVRRLLKNVSSVLKPGGYFFGATPDSSTIWYKYQKAVEGAMKAGSLRANGQLPRVRTELYNISFEDDRFHEYGSRYQLRFADDGLPVQSQLLVHFPSLIRLAKEVGLEYVEIQNLTEFYEDYRWHAVVGGAHCTHGSVPFADTLQRSCGTLLDAKGTPLVDGKSRLSAVAQDVLSLYTTFIFRKEGPNQRVNAWQVPTPSTSTVDVRHEKQSVPVRSSQADASKQKEKTLLKQKKTPTAVLPSGSSKKALENRSKNESTKASANLSRLPERVEVIQKVLKSESSNASPSSSILRERFPRAESSNTSASDTKTTEKILKSEGVDLRIDDSRAENSRHGNKNLTRSSDRLSENPNSSRRRSESQQRSETSARESERREELHESVESQDSMKKRRTSRGARLSTSEVGEEVILGIQPQVERNPDQKKDSVVAEQQRSRSLPLRQESGVTELQLERSFDKTRESGVTSEHRSEGTASELRETGMIDHHLEGPPVPNRDSETGLPSTTAQRYGRTRATTATQRSEGMAESSQMWSNHDNKSFKNERDDHAGPIHHFRNSFADLVGPARPMRVGDRRENLSHAGPGLLGAGPPNVINAQREKRFDQMGPSERLRNFGPSQADSRVTRTRSMRGSLYKDRMPGRPLNNVEFGGEATHMVVHGKGGLVETWDEHMKGDGKGRNR